MGMRKGMHNTGIIRHDDGRLIAICLGSDFTAEHEWGIEKMKESLGINDDHSIYGIERRRISCGGDRVVHIESPNHVLFMMSRYETPEEVKKGITPDNMDKLIKKSDRYPFHYDSLSVGRYIVDGKLSPDPKWVFTGAWCENSFGILANRSKLGDDLRELKEAFDNNDIGVWIGGNVNPFSNGGLVISIISRMSDEQKQMMFDADKDAAELKAAAEATQIRQRIDKINDDYRKAEHKKGRSMVFEAPCAYYALSPRWMSEDRDFDSKHPVIFWLNPREQQENEAGWYTVEDLELWMEGKGPVKERSKAKSNA